VHTFEQQLFKKLFVIQRAGWLYAVIN